MKDFARSGSFAPSAAFLLLLLHCALCWRMIDGWKGIRTPYPILRDDHTFNYYYAVTTKSYIAQSATTAGYDPYFMAGYAKSIIYPTSSTLPELILNWLGGDHPERVFKIYVIAVAMLCPLLLWVSSYFWTGQGEASLFALILYLTYFWSSQGAWYIVVGMVPYVLAGVLATWCVASIATFSQVSDPQSSLRDPLIGHWIVLAFVTAIAIMIHLTVAIVCAPAWLIMLIVSWRNGGPKKLAVLFFAGIVVIGINLFWLLPGLSLWETKGRTDVVFVEPDVIGRFKGLVTGRAPVEGMLLLLAAAGLYLVRKQLPLALGLGITITWTFLLAYPAGWVRALDFLQPGRYALYLYTFATIPAGIAITEFVNRIRSSLRIKARGLVGPSFSVAVCGLGVFVSWNNLKPVLAANPPVLGASMPRHFEELIHSLRQFTQPGERVLFEDRNRGIVHNGVPVLDPFLSIRPAPLLPLMTGLEVIGGPYLYNHHRTNFTQVGDGRFFGAPHWDLERFRQFAESYDIEWIVCWSPEARQFCAQNPGLIEVVTIIGPQTAPLWVGKVKRTPTPAIVGKANVRATSGRIEVTDAQAKDGELVLRYHWTPNLVSEPPLQIDAYPIPEDPVGLIRIKDPPANFVIHLDPWKKLRAWLPGL